MRMSLNPYTYCCMASASWRHVSFGGKGEGVCNKQQKLLTANTTTVSHHTSGVAHAHVEESIHLLLIHLLLLLTAVLLDWCNVGSILAHAVRLLLGTAAVTWDGGYFLHIAIRYQHNRGFWKKEILGMKKRDFGCVSRFESIAGSTSHHAGVGRLPLGTAAIYTGKKRFLVLKKRDFGCVSRFELIAGSTSHHAGVGRLPLGTAAIYTMNFFVLCMIYLLSSW
jgi:hypothetical protein